VAAGVSIGASVGDSTGVVAADVGTAAWLDAGELKGELEQPTTRSDATIADTHRAVRPACIEILRVARRAGRLSSGRPMDEFGGQTATRAEHAAPTAAARSSRVHL
jgi:hypothetical protein